MTSFFSATVGPVPAMMLVVLAVVCAVTDLWKGKIYNKVTYSAILAGFAVHLWLGGVHGLWSSLGGFAVGYFPAFLLFMLGGLGGGDVKLLGAIGAIAGAIAATETLILAFLFGAVFALCKLAWHGRLFASFGRVLRTMAGYLVPGLSKQPLVAAGQEPMTVRFGVAICVATLATLWDLRAGGLWALVAS